ncbi:DNA-binding response regulator [Tamilnaduibacter salinus]|uniref:DNA-binding response regulator n=1 Tax=Tamilnaduibacter salinus TaxID=1484056 RepID=A0A2A2I539_9GAMM|nr:response regulator transcription factor [Tamilnaduibacter salinus]PAV26416.1 DNA-binding response regulator [Tamilnaduibacter salinus]
MRLLLVEDDAMLVQSLRPHLTRAGFAVDCFHNAKQALAVGHREDYKAAILDIGLPDGNGLDILRKWRQQGVLLPILLLTARGDWQDKVSGLKAGADDYLAKPFHVEELIARLNALVRRSEGHATPILTVGRYQLDQDRQQVCCADGQWQNLTGMEYRMLRYFMTHPERILSKDDLLEQLYSLDAEPSHNLIEAYVRRLRVLLGRNVIQTRRGQGYVFDPQ